jgi:Mn2+/Fe2+ NRAMP family transporter
MSHAPQRSDVPAVVSIENPPTTLRATLRRLGPGLIIAGSIVGSGELIATTKTGAQAGISLLWLIVVGCVIKVFVQIELGRHTITHGETTLSALNTLPGPRWRINWVLWFWFAMMIAGLGQLGGIVGGVGQSLAMALPLTGDYRKAIAVPSAKELERYLHRKAEHDAAGGDLSRLSATQRRRLRASLEYFEHPTYGVLHRPDRAERVAEALQAVDQLRLARQQYDQATQALQAAQAEADPDRLRAAQQQAQQAANAYAAAQRQVRTLLEPWTWDDKVWAAVTALATIALLFRGRYVLVQNVSTVLVVTFTLVTIGNVLALQMHEKFSLTWSDLLRGFGLPEATADVQPLATALMTFGIIGVGATELIAYPYWCLEKGYARFTGPRADDDGWARRARGWMRVMHVDAFVSMVIYTVATVAFYLMGVTVLYRQGLDPEGMRMVGTLSEQYVPVFGQYASWLFLIGAVSVLYSTFLVANAGHGRMYTDSFKILGVLDPHDPRTHQRSLAFFAVLLPLIAIGIYCTGADPVQLVLFGAFMQALMLPILGCAAVYFRYRKSDVRLRPGTTWDVLLLLSCVGLFIAGGWLAWNELSKLLK